MRTTCLTGTIPKYCYVLLLLLVCGLQSRAQYTVRGTVTADNGAVPRASIHVLNSALATSADESGNFVLEGVPAGTQVLRISALGYAAENRLVSVNGNLSLDVRLSGEDRRLEEAVVTVRKQEDDPHDVAASLSVVSGREVEQRYTWNIADIGGMVPNLNLANPGDNRNVASIRGITTTSYNQAVATYVDGVNQFGLDTYIPYLFDVERIEVLRGPQGTLYGRNAMAGVINIITKQPDNRIGGFAEVSIGNYGQQRYAAGVRLPVVKDKLFFGASGMFNGLNGFYTNTFDESHYDRQHTVFGNYYVKYLPSSQWAFTLNVKHVANRNDGAFALIMGLEDAFESPFELSQNAKTTMVDDSRNVSLSINHFCNSVIFSSQTAYQSNYRYYRSPIDGDFSPADIVAIVNNYGRNWNHVKVFTQEFKVSSALSRMDKIHWTGGLFLFHQDAPTRQGTHLGADAIYMGDEYADFVNTVTILTNSAINRGAAVYGQLGFRFARGWEVQAGLRYDYERAELKARGEFQPDGGSLIEIQPDTVASANFHAVSPSVTLQYTFNDAHQVYGTYSRGFRAGGISQLSSDENEASLRAFAPEYSDNIELGAKQLFFNRRLSVDLSLFYTRLTDAQVPTLVLPDAITVTRNTGKMESLGAELEVSARPIRPLSVWGSAGFTRARYLDLNTAGEGGNVQLSGNRPVFTPDWTGFIGARYTVTLGNSGRQRIELGAYGKFIGQQYFTVENTLGQGAYSLLNATVGYSCSGYEIVLWVQNLADKRYVDYAYDFGFAAVHLARPATYGVTLRKKFGY